ncbi:MAG: hypothetical protein K2X35_13685, partial [Bryobacteraceae bacterium]|nr:hypothetical protein [Bryobacteraceae bacterium]
MTSRWPGLPWILPAVALLGALSIYPLLYAIYVSLTSADGSLTLAHFARLFQDRYFGVALAQTLLFTAVALAFEFVLGLALALLVDSLGRARSFFRAGLLLPMIVPPV